MSLGKATQVASAAKCFAQAWRAGRISGPFFRHGQEGGWGFGEGGGLSNGLHRAPEVSLGDDGGEGLAHWGQDSALNKGSLASQPAPNAGHPQPLVNGGGGAAGLLAGLQVAQGLGRRPPPAWPPFDQRLPC